METYSNVTRFCLICNYVTRIIDPLASRCAKFRFKPLDTSNALERLQYVAKQEDVKYEEGTLGRILTISAGDLRKAITLLQSGSKLVDYTGNDQITIKQIEELAGVVPTTVVEEMVKHINSKDLNQLIAFTNDFIKSGWSGVSIVDQLHDYYITNENYDTDFKNKLSLILFDTDSKLTNGTNEHIQLLNLLVKISHLIQ